MGDDMPTTSGKKLKKQHNTLPIWGNENSMNLNPLILANIQGSSYFKVHLFKLKTYHEVVDEIYYQVKHMEPWERGSRKTSGQTGMCGGVRGVGAGGIVSTAYCLLYKLYTLRLTRKQVNGLLNHSDSPYIRALGFMYIRYTQPPGDLYEWYEDYFLDEEEIDVKAGGGQVMTIGQMVYQFLTKLDWFSTLFPRIPVPIQKQIERMVEQYCRENNITQHQLSSPRTTASSANVVAYESEDNFRRGASSSTRGVQGYTSYSARERSPRNGSTRSRYEEDSYSHHRRHREHSVDKYSHGRDRSSRDRERERDRERRHDRNRERERERDRDYDRSSVRESEHDRHDKHKKKRKY